LFALCLLWPLAAGAGTETATVRHVVDGDTVILTDNRTVRLIGINAPEQGHDGRPDEPFARAARDRLKELVEGKLVNLLTEAEPRDRHGRTLAHLRTAQGSVEEVLIKEGLVSAVAVPPNVREAARLFELERTARSARRGLWGHAYATPRNAADLTTRDTGYRFVRGTVTRIGRSRKNGYLDLGPKVSVRIRHEDWQQYFRGKPEDWRGRALIARGWLSEHEGRLHIGVGHPLMMDALP
jgi:endonuclease YncB( thermonuclease family)